MAAGNPDRTGALVVRAWVEPGTGKGDLRARITYTPDISSTGDETVRVAASRDQILAAVSEWLDELAR